MSRPDVIVLGLGAHGAAALYQLALRGVRVLGVDRWSPPHAMGSSHGETRVTRLGNGEGEVYVPLALRSHEIWRDLEETTGETLLVQCGVLIVAPGDGQAQVHGKTDFIGRSAQAAQAFAIAHERLSGDEVRYRFPQFSASSSDAGYYEPDGGLVFPERCIGAQLAEAERLGAKVLRNTEVLAVEEGPRGVKLRTAGPTLEAGAVIVTAGAWTPGLASGALNAMKLQPQVLHWFEGDLSLYAAERCPVFVWTHGDGPQDMFYGFPVTPGVTQAVKVATEATWTIDTPAELDRSPPTGSAAALYARHLAGRLNGVSDRVVRSAVCVYTTAPDADFAVGFTGGGRMLVASACSGHGFKHSAALGELLAKAVVEAGPIPPEFSLNRPQLVIAGAE